MSLGIEGSRDWSLAAEVSGHIQDLILGERPSDDLHSHGDSAGANRRCHSDGRKAEQRQTQIHSLVSDESADGVGVLICAADERRLTR